jgi:hypothetical protein
MRLWDKILSTIYSIAAPRILFHPYCCQIATNAGTVPLSLFVHRSDVYQTDNRVFLSLSGDVYCSAISTHPAQPTVKIGMDFQSVL